MRDGLWYAADQAKKAAFICKKKVYDTCIFDMVEYGSYCIDFRLNEKTDMHSWEAANQLCLDFGMSMLAISSKTKDEFINQFLVDSQLFNVDTTFRGIWLGAKGKFKKKN